MAQGINSASLFAPGRKAAAYYFKEKALPVGEEEGPASSGCQQRTSKLGNHRSPQPVVRSEMCTLEPQLKVEGEP